MGLFAVEESRYGNEMSGGEPDLVCAHLCPGHGKKPQTNSLLEKKNLSTNKSPPPGRHFTLPDRERSMGMPTRRKAQRRCDPG